jgi:UDP:flavonoid glycosyltransferase YjiC (YdhE family)
VNAARSPLVLVSAVGLAGHALPAIALARELKTRGADVAVQTSDRWSGLLAELGLERAPATEYFAGPGERADGAGEAAALADSARALIPILRDVTPDVVVCDGLTAAPALAAESEGLRWATVFPEVYPVHAPRLPPFASGLHPPRTAAGGAAWSAALSAWKRLPGTRSRRRAFNREREALGLEPEPGFHGTLSDDLTMVGTFPQLEYPRAWPAHVHVTGPLMLDPSDVDVELPPGHEPLVVVASSTVKDMERRLVRVTLEALADEPVRVLVTMGGAGKRLDAAVPANAVVAEWVSFERVMPLASAVVCNGNHGTITWALAHGAPVLVSPAMDDDAEHGARVGWSQTGLMVPRALLRPGTVRLAVRRLLHEPRFRVRARDVAAWSRANDGAPRAAELVEELAR